MNEELCFLFDALEMCDFCQSGWWTLTLGCVNIHLAIRLRQQKNKQDKFLLYSQPTRFVNVVVIPGQC